MKADKEFRLRVFRKRLLDSFDKKENAEETKMNHSKRAKKANKFMRIGLVIFSFLLLLFLIFNINYLTPSRFKEHMKAVFADMGKGDGFPYNFSSNEVHEFFRFNDNDYVVLTNRELIILNASAKPVLKYNHNMSNPIVKYSSDRILLFDQGSTKAVILNQSGEVVTFPNENKIICGDISNSGKSVLATSLSSKEQELNVYAFSGKKIMSWKKGTGYILDAAMNSSGSLCSVALVDTVDAVQTVSIISFNTGNAKQKGHIDLSGSLLYDMQYLNSSELAVICNNKLAVLDSSCELKQSKELSSAMNIKLFCDKNGHIISAYSLYNNGVYSVDVYNSSLKQIASKQYRREIMDISSDGTRLAILFSDQSALISTINSDAEYGCKLDNDCSFILNKGKRVFTCSSSSVTKYNTAKQ